MPYGLQCWDENNDLTLDTDGKYSRLIFSDSFSSSGSVDLSDLSGKESVQWAEYLDSYGASPEVSRSDTTISWTNPPTGGSFRVLVFIYT